MAARKLSKNFDQKPEAMDASIDALMDESGSERAADVSKGWKYIDFIDPKVGTPVLPLEWLFGARGFLSGRIMKLEADEGVGKSSFQTLAFGMGQRAHNAVCLLAEAERADFPADRVADLGCDPGKLRRKRVNDVVGCLTFLTEMTQKLRAIDPQHTRPLMMAIDSISSLSELAMEDEDYDPMEAVGDLGQQKQPGKHARVFSEWLRTVGVDTLEKNGVLLTLIGQLKNTISKGPTFGAPPEKKTLGGEGINFHSTYILRMSGSKLTTSNGVDIGTQVNMFTKKNKISPAHRRLSFDLHRVGGFDLVSSLGQALIEGSFDQKTKTSVIDIKQDSGWWLWPELSDKRMRIADMADKLYANTDLLMSVRERMRVRGFGFKFETDYTIQQAEKDAEKEPAE